MHPQLSRRIPHTITLLLAAVVVALMALVSASTATATTSPVPNPDLQPACGAKVILVLDESGSIDSTTGAEAAVRDAAKKFASGLADTGSQLAVIEFGSSAKRVFGYTTVTSGAGGTLTTTFNPYFDGTAAGDKYDAPSQLGQWTNWEDALKKVKELNTASGVAPLVVFVTDGDPTADQHRQRRPDQRRQQHRPRARRRAGRRGKGPGQPHPRRRRGCRPQQREQPEPAHRRVRARRRDVRRLGEPLDHRRAADHRLHGPPGRAPHARQRAVQELGDDQQAGRQRPGLRPRRRRLEVRRRRLDRFGHLLLDHPHADRHRVTHRHDRIRQLGHIPVEAQRLHHLHHHHLGADGDGLPVRLGGLPGQVPGQPDAAAPGGHDQRCVVHGDPRSDRHRHLHRQEQEDEPGDRHHQGRQQVHGAREHAGRLHHQGHQHR